MKLDNILLQVLINGMILFLLFSSFVNMDLLKIHQIAILSIIVINGYLLNKKLLQKEDCKLSWKQILVGLGMGVSNFIILFVIKRIFS